MLIGREHFFEQVGIPRIAYFDNPSWFETSGASAASNTAFIQIPHIHPGRDQYGKQPENLRRVLLLTWMVTVTVGQYMLEALSAVEENEEEPREAICNAVIKRCKKEAAPLIGELKDAKSALDEDWQRQSYPQSVRSLPKGVPKSQTKSLR
jgi:hypothetical protein